MRGKISPAIKQKAVASHSHSSEDRLLPYSQNDLFLSYQVLYACVQNECVSKGPENRPVQIQPGAWAQGSR